MKIYCEGGRYDEKVIDAPKESHKVLRAGREQVLLRDEAGQLIRYARLRFDREDGTPWYRWDPFGEREQAALSGSSAPA